MDKGRSGLQWVRKDSVVWAILVRRASSLAVHAWRQSGRMCGLENFSNRLTKVSESRRGRPKIICAGDRLQSRSGVFRSCRMARKNRSWSRLPVGPVLDIKSCLAALTATSALPFDWGKLTDDTRCFTFHKRRKVSVLWAVNSGPPSLESSSGTPNVAKNVRKWRTRPVEPPRSVPAVERSTSTQPENRSPTTR